ncbi:MAG TPA: transporter substrate-binding domain-containing protein [Telluria sp.]|nr:transporter substrate-binding domain-containing protein [Telluria sp.]
MRPFPLAPLLCAALLGGAAHGAPVRILVEDAASPWSNHAGEGYANDLVRAAFAAAGAAADLVVVPYARCKALVMQGGAPACFSMSAAPELERVVRFADKPLFSVTPRFYFNARQPLAARSVAELAAGTRVGIVHGYEYPPFVAGLAQRGIVLESARSDVANLQKLAAGRLDTALVMTDDMRSEELIQRQAGVAAVGFAFATAPMGSYIGFSTRHPDGEAQRRLFNQGFQAISANGTRQAIEAKWKRRCARVCPE